MNGYHDGAWRVGEWLAMGTMMLLFWGLLLGLVLWVLRRDAASTNELLRYRFARGDIDADEFGYSRELVRRDGSGVS